MTSEREPPIRRPSTRADLENLSAEQQAVVYLAVDWSGPERRSRAVFAQAVEHLLASCRDNGRIAFYAVHDDCEGFAEWAEARAIPWAIAGSGTVVWLRNGNVVSSEVSAAATGVEKLVGITMFLFGSRPST
jgi:hypothetical protein